MSDDVREDVLDRVRKADTPVHHAELVYQVEMYDRHAMTTVESAIGTLLDADRLVDTGDITGPAYEVA